MTDPHVVQHGHAPTPFTAAEIRAGCRPGREIRIVVEGPGDSRFVRVIRFIEGDAEGALQESQRFTMAGEPIDQAIRERTKWSDFQSHASFPAEATTIQEDRVETPAGTFDCLRYDVHRGDGLETFWFAVELPGMPVKVETREEGKVTFAMTMTENVTGVG